MKTIRLKAKFCHTKPLALLLLSSVMIPGIAIAKPTTEDQARRVVRNWIALDNHPLQTSIGKEIKGVATFLDDTRTPAYYIVSLVPQGFVIVPADDTVEPIIGFVPIGEYTPSLDNPLGALVSQDVPSRVQYAQKMEQQAATPAGMDYLASETTQLAQKKWGILDRDKSSEASEFGLSSISDVRVAPLVQTLWAQTTESGGNQCYNIYTPNNYPCGCVATAFAQIMRFWQFPTIGVGTPSFAIEVDGVSQIRSLLGGDGSGGAYSWGLMDYGPGISVLSHRQAIGRLTHDAGVAVNMSYSGSGSGANTLSIADSLKNTFGYANAKKGYNSGNNLPTTNRNNMVNPNLDAGYPVAFGITGTPGGHAIVGDGYGYNTSTLYHHLNMGWSGSNNAWYNLPTIDAGSMTFTSVYKCVYNIYPTGAGEIISGRVVDAGGNPVNGATVTANKTGGGTYTATTNAKGIYAIPKIPSASSYAISIPGYTTQNVATLTSTDSSTTVGNLWGVNFAPSSTTYTLTVNSSGASNVAITGAPSTYGGTTNYDKPGIASGTSVILTAPLTSGSAAFSSWNGCASSAGRTCNLTITSNTTVTAYYAPSSATLGEAVDNTGLTWTTGGDGNWINQTTTTYFGGDAAESATISDGQQSSMQTIVNGPGTLSFYWKVSSEKDYDYLNFYINGDLQGGGISGAIDWNQKTFAIPAGSHTLQWVYSKDCCENLGSDRGWVDKVEWTSGGKFPWPMFLPAITKGE